MDGDIHRDNARKAIGVNEMLGHYGDRIRQHPAIIPHRYPVSGGVAQFRRQFHQSFISRDKRTVLVEGGDGVTAVPSGSCLDRTMHEAVRRFGKSRSCQKPFEMLGKLSVL